MVHLIFFFDAAKNGASNPSVTLVPVTPVSLPTKSCVFTTSAVVVLWLVSSPVVSVTLWLDDTRA
jgi:hypothetical protein